MRMWLKEEGQPSWVVPYQGFIKEKVMRRKIGSVTNVNMLLNG